MADEEVVEEAAEEEAVEEFVHEAVPAENIEEAPIEEEEEPVLEADWNNRAWVFREYVLNQRSMEDIAAEFDVPVLKVKKNLMDWDMFENFRETSV